MKTKAILLAFTFLTLFSCTRDLSEYDILLDPRISTKPDQKMITVELKGDPTEVSGDAIGALYKTFFGLRKEYKDLNMKVAPVARWPVSEEVPRDQWVGIFGLPIPDEISELPSKEIEDIEVEIRSWDYGEVAEILHVGPYSEEEPTVKRLKDFISASGYKIVGNHEEEYLQGPGMLFKVKPEKYKTVIRYNVKKIQE